MEADSFDMNAAQESLTTDLFPEYEETKDEVKNEISEEDNFEESDEEDTSEETEDNSEEDSDEETEDDSEEESDEETSDETKRVAPQSWKKEMHEAFSKLPDDVKDYIELREEQMREGLEKDRNDANLGRTMRDIVEPHSALLQSQGVHGEDAVKFFMNAHARLTTAPPSQKLEEAKQFLKVYGIDLDNLQNKAEVDPKVQQLEDQLYQLQNNMTIEQQRTQQASQAQVISEVEKFASEHPHFDDVAEDIVGLIHAGYTLDEAYEKAIWANPDTRQAEIDRLQKESESKRKSEAKKKAEEAKKAASVNVRSRDTNQASTAPTGTMEDTLLETYREIQNR